MKILLVEDDASLARAISERIAGQGYAVDHVSAGEDAEAALATINYSLVILDRRLPDGDGVGRIGAFRRYRPDVRIIALTALDATFDKIEGLEAGADDYLTKPFEIDELIARVRAALRRPGAVAQPIVRCGNLSFDPSNREFQIGSDVVLLKRRELLVLEALIMRAQRVVQRSVFMDQVYGFDEEIQSNTLDAHISRLRSRLSELGAGVIIHPIRGVGYMLSETPRE